MAYTSSQIVQAVPTGINSALVLIKTQTIGTTVSSVTVSDVFSSTYDNYRIIVSGGIASTQNRLNLTFGATATGYYRFTIYGNYTSTTVTGENASNTDKFADAGTGSANSLVSNIEVFAPNLAKRTSIITNTSTSETGQYVFTQQGFLNDSTQYTAFTLTTSTGTITGGTIRVYGYTNS